MPAELEIRYSLGAAQGWSAFESRIAFIVLMSHLLRPSSRRRRDIECVLLADKLEVLQSEARGDDHFAVLKAVRENVAKAVTAIAKRKSSQTYQQSLMIDLDQKKPSDMVGTVMRGLVGGGLIVRTMYESSQGGESIGPEKAKDIIAAKHTTNPLLEARGKGLRDAWIRNRPIAPLAAALLQYICDRGLRQFGPSEHDQLCLDIVAYLQHAMYFQNLLEDLKKTNSRLRFPTEDILRVPTAWAIAPVEPKGQLRLPSRLPTIHRAAVQKR